MALFTEGRVLYFVAETPAQTQDWIASIMNKIASISYVKKMRALRRDPDRRVLRMFHRPHDMTLELVDQPLSMEAVVALMQPLQGHAFLSTIVLRGARIDTLVCGILCSALSKSEVLKVLDLSKNQIDDVKDLTRMMYQNRSLEVLRLDQNPLGDKNVALLFSRGVCLHVPRLSFLSLDGTMCGDEGVQAAMAAIDSVPLPFRSLSLSHNQVGPRGAACIGAALRKMRGRQVLEVLSLGFNRLGNEGCQALTGFSSRSVSAVANAGLSMNPTSGRPLAVGNHSNSSASGAGANGSDDIDHGVLSMVNASGSGLEADGVPGAGFGGAPELPGIRILDVSHNDVGIVGLRALAQIRTLEMVAMGGNRFSEQVLKDMLQLASNSASVTFPVVELTV